MKVMTNPDLDGLRKSLQAAGDKTQQAIDRHECGILSSYFDVDEQGKPAFFVWQCRLPAGDGRERNHEMLRLPWTDFQESEHALKEISIAFDCEITRDESGDSEQVAQYTLRPQPPGGSHPRHQFKMTLGEDNDFVVESAIDGVPLDVFLEQTEIASVPIPFYQDLCSGLKAIGAVLMKLSIMFFIISAAVMAWLYLAGSI